MVREELKRIEKERIESAKEGGLVSDVDIDFFEKVFLTAENSNEGE